MVFTSQSKSCLSGYECLRQHPQKCWAAGTCAWRAGRAARRVVSLPAAIHGQGNRKQAEKREEHPGALCDMAGESSTFQGLCIMHIAWDYVKPLCSSSLSRAKSSAGPGQFGEGGTCSHTDGDTGAPATGGGPPLPACPAVPTGISHIAFSSLEAGHSLREPSEDPAPSYSLAQLCQGLCLSRSRGQCPPPEASAGNVSAISSSISSMIAVC